MSSKQKATVAPSFRLFSVAKRAPKSHRDEVITRLPVFISASNQQTGTCVMACRFFFPPLHRYVKSSVAAGLDTTVHPELLAAERKNRTVDNRWIWNNRCCPNPLSAPANWRRSRKTTCSRLKCVCEVKEAEEEEGRGGEEWAGCLSTRRGWKGGIAERQPKPPLLCPPTWKMFLCTHTTFQQPLHKGRGQRSCLLRTVHLGRNQRLSTAGRR